MEQLLRFFIVVRFLVVLAVVAEAAGCHPRSTSIVQVRSDGGATVDARAQMVNAAATGDPACTGLGDFYWEVGDAHGTLISGAVGSAYHADTELDIASASKLLFGAYVVQRFQTDLTQADFSAMTMRKGYVSLTYDSCVGQATVADCFHARHALGGFNDVYTASADNLFDYSGGHFQWYAAGVLGLGGDNNAQLATDLRAQLGTELQLAYSSPQLAAGAHMSAAQYAAFLQKVLAGGLALRDHLGENAVCTEPSVCNTARYSPASPHAWHYSWGHWVEDDAGGDGAFSSPGYFGFYPWIDASRTYYGLLARQAGALDTRAYVTSATCGARLRKAFLTGS